MQIFYGSDVTKRVISCVLQYSTTKIVHF